MTEPFLGEIQVFAFNFAPVGWAFCNGATLAVQQNTALFSLIGITYGGNGSTTFQLPNFVTRSACEQGQGPNTSLRRIGDTFGTPNVTLSIDQMPAHNHGLTYFSQNDATKRTSTPAAGSALSVPTEATVLPFLAAGTPPTGQFAPTMIMPAGGGQPHENQQPYLAVNFCIALRGNFPSFG